MKKLFFLTIFLFLCGVALYYYDPFKIFTIDNQEVRELLETDYEIDLPEEMETKQEDKQLTDNEYRFLHGIKPKQEMKEVTVDSIISDYEQSLLQLKEQVDDKLNHLMELAYEDYQKQKKEGKGNLVTLYLKYQKAIDELEENTDQSFAEVYEKLVEELEKHQFDVAEAEKLKDQYEEMKEKTRQVMFNKVMDKFEV